MYDFKQFINSVTDINGKKVYTVIDHINGFDKNYNNPILDHISNSNNDAIFDYEHPLPDFIKQKYNNLQINFNLDLYYKNLFSKLHKYETVVEKNKIENFLCCFLGSEHVSRQLLSAILIKSKIWKTEFCRKDFTYTIDTLDGNISSYLDENSSRFYRKFFIDYTTNINLEKNSIDYIHSNNFHNLEIIGDYFKKSFVALIPETIGTSFVPFITEKFVNAVLTKTLFVTYGQPNWHNFLENVYGFRLYNKIFNYEFDQVDNPVIRIVKLMEMISKFQNLNSDDWHDLYLIEKDTIDYNYDHWHSKSYLKNLAKFA